MKHSVVLSSVGSMRFCHRQGLKQVFFVMVVVEKALREHCERIVWFRGMLGRVDTLSFLVPQSVYKV